MVLSLFSLAVLSQPVDPAGIALSPDCRDHLPLLRQAFLDADERAFRYLRVDVPTAGLKRDEVVIALPRPTQLQVWRGLSNDEVRVANVNGDVRHVLPSVLTTVRPAKVFIPAQMPPVSAGTTPAACMAPAEKRDTFTEEAAQLDAEAASVRACAEGAADKMDTTTAGANRYDLVTTRGGRVTDVKNYGDVLYDKAWKKCGGPKVEAAEKKLGRRLDDAWRSSWGAHRAALVGRFSKAPRGPAATAVVAPDDEAM